MIADRRQIKRRFVSLLCLMVMLFLSLEAKAVLAQDWFVTGPQVVENDAILLNGNLIIENGGDLTLRGVTLTMNNTYNGEYGIRVKFGGSIIIENGTVITTASDSFHFTFVVEAGTRFSMKDSELHRCGWGEPFPEYDDTVGLTILANSPDIQNNLFSDNFVAIRLRSGSGGTITGNHFTANVRDSINLEDWTRALITDNTFSDSINGLFIVEGSGHTIRRNRFSRHFVEGPMFMFNGWDNEFSANQVEGPGGVSICRRSGNNRFLNNILTDGACFKVIRSTNNLIKGNTITGTPETGIYLEYASKNIVANNTISETLNDAIHLHHASDNVILNNIISPESPGHRTGLNGILVWSDSKNNIIQSNHILSASRGISLHYSADHNRIISNHIYSSEQQGIIVEGSSNNNIYANNFIDNGMPPYDDTGENTWDNGSIGNYWSDYSGDGSAHYTIPKLGIDRFPSLTPMLIDPAVVPEFSPVPEPSYPWKSQLTIAEPKLMENETLVLDSLSIEAGGSLTLRNMTVDISGPISEISVEPQGALYIYQSKSGPTNPENGGYTFHIRPGAIFVMKNSEVYGAGRWPGVGDWAGLYVQTTNAVIENNLIRDCQSGISLDPAKGARITGNIVTRCGCGITLVDANGSTVAHNTISHCLKGGIGARGNKSTIEGNRVSKVWGMAMGFNIDDSTIGYNTVLNSQHGIWIEGSHNTIAGNKIRDIWNSTFVLGEGYENLFLNNIIDGGFQGLGFTPSTGKNIVYNNSFMNIATWSFDSGSDNQWDNGTQGNYWSDYTGADADGNGIGDTPYYIGPNGVDRYPLIAPFENSHPPKAMPWIPLLLLGN